MSFVFAGLVTLVSVFMLIFWFVETFIQKKENHQEMGERFKNLKKSLRLPGIPTLFLCFFIFSIGWSFYWDFIPVTWVEGYKQNASNVGNFYAYGSLFYVLSCAFFIRPILKKFQTEKILLVSWVFLGIVILPLLYSWLGMFWILLPFQQFAIALLLPAGATQISNSVDKYQQGAVLGAFQSVQSIAFASTPFLGGTAVGMNYNMPIIIGGIAMLLAGFVFFVGYRKTH